MEREFINVSIESYRHREGNARERATEAIGAGQYEVALLAIAEAMGYKTALEELEFQLEAMGVRNA